MLNKKSILSQDIDFYSTYTDEEHQDNSLKEALVKGVFYFILFGLFLLFFFYLYPSKINFKNLFSFESTKNEVMIDTELSKIIKNQPLVTTNKYSKEEIQEIVLSVMSELSYRKETKRKIVEIPLQTTSNKEIDELINQIRNELK